MWIFLRHIVFDLVIIWFPNTKKRKFWYPKILQTNWWWSREIVRVGSEHCQVHAWHLGVLGEAVGTRGSLQNTPEHSTRTTCQVPPHNWGTCPDWWTVSSFTNRCGLTISTVSCTNDHIWTTDYLYSGKRIFDLIILLLMNNGTKCYDVNVLIVFFWIGWSGICSKFSILRGACVQNARLWNVGKRI